MSDETLPSDDASAPRWLTKARAFFAAPGVAHALRVIAGALLLMVPILLNGRPFPFTDTATYFQSGYYVIQSFTDRYVPISDFSRSYLGARSPFYGLPLTGLEAIGTLWLVVALQALAAAQMLDMMARAIGGALARTIYWTSIIALMLVSSLPLFIGFVMPDLSAAFAAIAIALLVFYPERAARWERIGLWIALTAALTFHLTHMFVAVFAMPAALGLHWLLKMPERTKRAVKLGAAFAIGAVAWIVLAVVNTNLPKPLYSPPFLTARVLADGPGKAYLRHACAADKDRYVLCVYADKPFNNSDEILWSWSKERGVFATAPHAMRVQLMAEQRRFVLDSILYDPMAQIRASSWAFVKQLAAVGVDEGFKLDAHFWMTYPPDFYLKTMAIRVNLCPEPLVKCPARLPLEEISVWNTVWVGIASVYLLGWTISAFVTGGLRNDAEMRLFAAFGAALLFTVIVNAAVCGILSGPFPRYQARIAWLIPALAIIAELRFGVIKPAILALRAALPPLRPRQSAP